MMSGNIKDDVLRSATSVAVGYAIINTIANSSAKVPINFAGRSVSLGTAFPIAVGLGTFLSSFSHDYILKHIPHNENYINLESAAISAGVSGGVPAALIYSSNKDYMGKAELAKLFVLGAGSSALGSYTYDSFVAPVVGTLSK